MAKSVRKRKVKIIEHNESPVKEPEITPNEIPIIPCDKKTVSISCDKKTKKIPTVYSMTCQAGDYQCKSWLELGWTIFKHRLWHLYNDGSFRD